MTNIIILSQFILSYDYFNEFYEKQLLKDHISSVYPEVAGENKSKCVICGKVLLETISFLFTQYYLDNIFLNSIIILLDISNGY